MILKNIFHQRLKTMKKYIKTGSLLILILILHHCSDNYQLKEILTKSGIEMVYVSNGLFVMGDEKGDVDEEPHKIYINSFYIDKYLVTQEEYEKVTGENPSRWKGEKNPVEQMRWSDAVKYCNARSSLENLQPCYNLENWECNFEANGYRLPTEAEWEYACRAGTKTTYFFGLS